MPDLTTQLPSTPPPSADLGVLAARLPTVIATPLAEYLEEPHPVLVLWHLCDLVELSLRFLVIAGLAEHEGRLPEALARALEQYIERPTLGGWRVMANTVAKAQPAQSLLPELPSTVNALDMLIGRPDDTPERGLLALRNRLAHGGGLRKEAARLLASAWQPKLAAALPALGWLVDTKLVAVGAEGGAVLLVGLEAQPITLTEAALPSATTPGSALWLVRGNRALGLWPLGCYNGTAGFEQVQVYMRRDEVRLLYTVLGGEVALGESAPEAVALFLRLFRLDADLDTPRGLVVRGFESSLRQEAARRIGRETEFAQLREAARSSAHRVVWVTGPAGIGKSNLMACLAEELLDDPPARTLVLPYRFRASDDRCSRDTFLRFAIERLTAWSRVDAAGTTPAMAHLSPFDQLRSLIARVREGDGVLFVLDGLDEIAERDRRFAADVLLALVRDGARAICAGRPEHGLAETFARAGSYEPFASGMPRMTSNDVRAMLLIYIDRLRTRLVKRDREAMEGVRNPFVERVVQLSEGLPLYVGYVVRDLASGRLAPESESQLPADLHAYHAELLRRCVVGDLHAVMTPLVALLALAREPLTSVTIAALLVRRGVLATANVSLVERALAAVATMVRRTPGPDDRGGFVLYHHSLRIHILASDQMTETVAVTRHSLAAAALHPAGDAAEVYLHRCGVAHLVDEGRHAEALTLLTDFDGVMTRFERLGSGRDAADGWYADWGRVRSCHRLEGEAVAWWDFARANRHHFQKEGWSAEKVLFQAAMDHADDSPVTRAAERFAAASRCNWLWLRQVNRLKEYQPSPTLVVLAGHRDSVRGATQLEDGRILSWANATVARDGTLRLWGGATGESLAVLEGHKYGANGALALPEGRILSWSRAEPTIRLWDGTSGAPLAPLSGHVANVRGAMLLQGERILSWCARTLRVWNCGTGEPQTVLSGHTSDINGVAVLSDGRFLSWSAGCAQGEGDGELPTLKVWDSTTGIPVMNLVGHEGPIATATEISGGRILSWSHDRTLRTWDTTTGTPLVVFAGHADRVIGAVVSAPERILSWSADKTLRLWDATTGACVAVLEGHRFAIKGALLLPDGDVLSWCTDRVLRLWNGSTGSPIRVLEGHEDVVRGATTLANGLLLTWSDDETLRLWDGTSGDALAVFAGHALAVIGASELTDGRLLSWSDDHTLRLWDGEARVPRRVVIDGHADLVWSTRVLSGGNVLSWSVDGTLCLWDGVDGKRLATLIGHVDPVNGAMALGEDRILSWAQEGIRIWNQLTGSCIAVLAAHLGTDGAALLRDGRILSWSRDRTLRLWDIETGQLLAVLEGHSGAVVGALELETGDLLSWSDDHTLRLWDGRTAGLLEVLAGHPGPIQGAIEVADVRILSWSKDECLRLWDGRTGARLAVLEGHTSLPRGAVGLPDGRLLSWSHDQTVRLWDRAGAPLTTCHHPGWIRGAKPLPDGRFVSWSAEEVRVWDGVTDTPLGNFRRDHPRDMLVLAAEVGGSAVEILRQTVEALALDPCSTDDLGGVGLASSTSGRFIRIHQLMFGPRRIDWPELPAILCR